MNQSEIIAATLHSMSEATVNRTGVTPCSLIRDYSSTLVQTRLLIRLDFYSCDPAVCMLS